MSKENQEIQSENPPEQCELCPRDCKVNRLRDRGYCGETYELKVARAALHMWEEPCISGDKGSGTVFFAGCNLRCIFCQNYSIAHGTYGKLITVERLAEIFLELQEKGAENINLVTPTHYVLQIIKAILIAKSKGLKLPIVYNTGCYETVESLRLLEGIVDIYLPDFKYADDELSKNLSRASNYYKVASLALQEMIRQQPEFRFNEKGMMQKGVIVRHLVLPGHTGDSMTVIKYLHETYGNKIFISIMNQFTTHRKIDEYPELNRKITEEEYEDVVDFAVNLGVENGFIQEGGTAEDSFIPEFNLEGV